MADYRDLSRTKTCANCGGEFYRDRRNSYAYWERAKYCSSSCSGRAWATRERDTRKRFEKWFAKGDGCWEWTGATNDHRGGYGVFNVGGKMIGAHVFALELDGRPVARGQYACHTCDNPRCVNPSHLYVGTPADNVSDMLARGRARVGSRHYAARLTEDDVIYIRSSSEPSTRIAERFGVTPNAINACRARKTWKHV